MDTLMPPVKPSDTVWTTPLGRERRPELEEAETRVLVCRLRSIQGIPPLKFLVDQIKSVQAHINLIPARVAHWSRKPDPVRQLALQLWKGRNRNASSWGAGFSLLAIE